MKRKKRTHTEINFWQSNTDLMTGLALVLILIIMLLVLYLTLIPENDQPDPQAGDSYNVDDQLGDNTDESYRYPDTNGDYDDNRDTEENNENTSGGGGGGDEGGDPEETEYNERYPIPSSSGDEWGKSAVYATVIDGETGRAIRQAGITFELYEEQTEGDGGSLRSLNTYYPEKISYQEYETTEDGTFYLPEKVEEGHYYFKQITEMEGYDTADAVRFNVDDTYDWDEPYVVAIEISPSKNIIPVSLVDAETQEPISGGTFAVTAAENITTADGTVRFAENEQADTIEVNEQGYGTSTELYLGNYTVTQETVPQYYASVESGVDVRVSEDDGSTPETITFSCEKTKIHIRLSDELYADRKVEGAEFSLSCEADPELNQTAQTDENGEIVFTDLEKNTTYLLRQTSAPGEYKYDSSAVEIYVSGDGRIEGEAEAVYDLTNYIARVNINVEDRLFGNPLSDVNLALYDSDGQMIQSWTSSGSAETFENLPEGGYYVLIDGDENSRYDFESSEDEALQEVSITVWTIQDTAVAAAAVILLILIILTVLRIVKKRRASKKNGQEEVPEKVQEEISGGSDSEE